MDGNPQRNIHFEEIWQQNNQILFTYLIFWQQKNNHEWENIQLLFFYSPLHYIDIKQAKGAVPNL